MAACHETLLSLVDTHTCCTVVIVCEKIATVWPDIERYLVLVVFRVVESPTVVASDVIKAFVLRHYQVVVTYYLFVLDFALNGGCHCAPII